VIRIYGTSAFLSIEIPIIVQVLDVQTCIVLLYEASSSFVREIVEDKVYETVFPAKIPFIPAKDFGDEHLPLFGENQDLGGVYKTLGRRLKLVINVFGIVKVNRGTGSGATYQGKMDAWIYWG